ncbi:MAG: hypothetical protein JXO72_11905 [Vicinamibacteria bacterium]|nr:hypothetical protein [Vicinamibacteria bacterium]
MEDMTTVAHRKTTIRDSDDGAYQTSAEALIEIADLMTELDALQTRRRRLVNDLDERRSALNSSFANLQREKKKLTTRTSSKKQTDDVSNATQIAAAVRQFEATHARRLSEFESARHISERERIQLSEQSRSLAQRRDALVAHLPQAAAYRYQALVSRGVERPIAAIDAEACGGCGATLRPLRSMDVRICTSCGRILIKAPRHVKGHA